MRTSSSSSTFPNTGKLILQGDHYKKSGQFDKAAEILEKVLAVKGQTRLKSSALIRTDLGEVYLGLGQFKKATKQFTLSLKVYKSFRSFAGLGSCFLGLKDPKKAIDNYRAALSLHPKAPSPALVQLLTNMGQAHAMTKECKAAKKAFCSAIEMYEKNFPLGPIPAAAIAYRGLGAIFGSQGKAKEAIAPLKSSARLFQAIYGHKSLELARSLNTLGMAYRKVDKKQAIEYFLSTYEICQGQLKEGSPLFKSVQKNFAWALKQLG